MRIAKVLCLGLTFALYWGFVARGASAVMPSESVHEEITIQEPDNVTTPLSKVSIESRGQENSEGSVCPGDFNGNRRVDFQDFLAFAAAFGMRSGDANYNAVMDLDGNGRVDFLDFLAFAPVFGTTCVPDVTVSIPDTSLRAVIADSLGKALDAPITRADMARLTRLDASDRNIHDLTGIEFAANLESLILAGNQFTGRIPSDVRNLTNLEALSFARNRLEGPIPPWLGSRTNLEQLFLYGNRLTGQIPRELGALTNLKWLYLDGNWLTGAIPPELGNLANLEQLYLASNQLDGPIPPELGRLTNLKHLHLAANELTGAIPPELGNLTNLEYLAISGNQLTGAIPRELGSLTNLETLILDGNTGLTGPLPGSFSAP